MTEYFDDDFHIRGICALQLPTSSAVDKWPSEFQVKYVSMNAHVHIFGFQFYPHGIDSKVWDRNFLFLFFFFQIEWSKKFWNAQLHIFDISRKFSRIMHYIDKVITESTSQIDRLILLWRLNTRTSIWINSPKSIMMISWMQMTRALRHQILMTILDFTRQMQNSFHQQFNNFR